MLINESSPKEALIKMLDELPSEQVVEVLDFAAFLKGKLQIQGQSQPPVEPLLSVAGILSGASVSAEEIERHLYGDGKDL